MSRCVFEGNYYQDFVEHFVVYIFGNKFLIKKRKTYDCKNKSTVRMAIWFSSRLYCIFEKCIHEFVSKN